MTGDAGVGVKPSPYLAQTHSHTLPNAGALASSLLPVFFPGQTRDPSLTPDARTDKAIKEGGEVKVSGPSNEVQLREMKER